MHCILEGLVQHHTHNLLQLTTGDTTATNSTMPAFHFDFQLIKSLNGLRSPKVAECVHVCSTPVSPGSVAGHSVGD